MYSTNLSTLSIHSLKKKNLNANFSFESLKIKHKIHQLISKEEFSRLFDLAEEDLCKFLENRGFYGEMTQDIDALFMNLKNTLMKEVRLSSRKIAGEEKTSSHSFLLEEYFCIPYDFINLKMIYKGKKSNFTFDQLNMKNFGLLSKEQLENLYKNKSLGFFPKTLKKFITQYMNTVIEDFTALEIDQLWDIYLHEFYIEILDQLKSDFLSHLFQLHVDIKNILTFLRFKDKGKDLQKWKSLYLKGGNIHLISISKIYKENIDDIIEYFHYLPFFSELKMGLENYKETQNLSEMEKLLSEYLLRNIKCSILLLEPKELIIAYYWMKLSQINNLRILFVSQKNHMSKDWALNQMRFII